MEPVILAVEEVVDLVGVVFTAITGNALLTMFLAATLFGGVGIGIFKRLKGAAR